MCALHQKRGTCTAFCLDVFQGACLRILLPQESHFSHLFFHLTTSLSFGCFTLGVCMVQPSGGGCGLFTVSVKETTGCCKTGFFVTFRFVVTAGWAGCPQTPRAGLSSGDAIWRRFKASQDHPRGQKEDLFGSVSVPGCLFCSVPLFVDFCNGTHQWSVPIKGRFVCNLL